MSLFCLKMFLSLWFFVCFLFRLSSWPSRTVSSSWRRCGTTASPDGGGDTGPSNWAPASSSDCCSPFSLWYEPSGPVDVEAVGWMNALWFPASRSWRSFDWFRINSGGHGSTNEDRCSRLIWRSINSRRSVSCLSLPSKTQSLVFIRNKESFKWRKRENAKYLLFKTLKRMVWCTVEVSVLSCPQRRIQFLSSIPSFTGKTKAKVSSLKL